MHHGYMVGYDESIMLKLRETTRRQEHRRVKQLAFDASNAEWTCLFCLPSSGVQTFLLKVTTRNTDGTTTVVKSVPCEAGSITEICFVEVRKIYPDTVYDCRCSLMCSSALTGWHVRDHVVIIHLVQCPPTTGEHPRAPPLLPLSIIYRDTFCKRRVRTMPAQPSNVFG